MEKCRKNFYGFGWTARLGGVIKSSCGPAGGILDVASRGKRSFFEEQSMRTMRKGKDIMRRCFLGCGLVLLFGMAVYAGQPRETSTSAKERAVKPAPIERAPDPVNPFSYEGPGVMVEWVVPFLGQGSGATSPRAILIFSPGETLRSPNIGFDLPWDKETIKAARAGEMETLDVTGWFDIEYDAETGVLEVHVTDESGQVFKLGYPLNADGVVEESKFLAHVHRFFEYMNSDADAGGVTLAVSVSGGSCSATNADGTVCCSAGPCSAGTYAQCSSTGTGCVCGCIFPSQ